MQRSKCKTPRAVYIEIFILRFTKWPKTPEIILKNMACSERDQKVADACYAIMNNSYYSSYYSSLNASFSPKYVQLQGGELKICLSKT